MNFQRKIGNNYNIMDKKRALLKEGFLYTINYHSGKPIRVYISLFNDLLIISENENVNKQFKPKSPLDLIGILVSENVNTFNVKQVRIKLPSANNNEVQLNADNGFAIYVPCIQKVFKFYTRYR
jgi:hypothetical protein